MSQNVHVRVLIRERVACPLALVLTLLLASCSGPRLDRLDRPVAETGTAQSRSVVSALERTTRATLKEEDLLALYREDPREGIRVLADRHRREPTESRRLALVEMCLDEGDRQTGPRPLIAMGHYLDGASLCEQQALAVAGRTVGTPDQRSYNYVAARTARLLHEQPRSEVRSVNAPGVLRPWRLHLAHGEGQMDPRDYDYVAPVSWLTISLASSMAVVSSSASKSLPANCLRMRSETGAGSLELVSADSRNCPHICTRRARAFSAS